MNKTKFVRPMISLCASFFVSQIGISGQTPGASGTPSAASMQTSGVSGTAAANVPAQLSIAPQTGEPAYQGSVPRGTASSTPIPLTLADAINRGLKANLGLLTSEQSSRQTRAERYRALSGLLPSVTGQLSMTEQQLNLQALGFAATFPPNLGFQIPKIVGPYSYQAAQ